MRSLKKKIEEGYFLEYAEVYGHYYGTPKDQVIRNEEEGVDSLFGHRRARSKEGKGVLQRFYPYLFDATKP